MSQDTLQKVMVVSEGDGCEIILLNVSGSFGSRAFFMETTAFDLQKQAPGSSTADVEIFLRHVLTRQKLTGTRLMDLSGVDS